MFGSGVKRQPDRMSAHQKRDAKSGPGRRPPDKPDKPQAPALCGWALPIIPDDNDIMVWMKREKNGDNKRKKINEVYEEEHYRHILGHCKAIENKLLFDRQSLHDRYLKNCQYGVRDARANKVAPVTPLPGSQSSRVSRPPSQYDRKRNCYSANAAGGDVDGIDEEGEEEEEEDVGKVEVQVRVPKGRSHSAVCKSVSVPTYSGRLADSTPVRPVAGEEGKDEAEDAGWDEGYGSKVSSNDQEQDGVEEDSTKTLDDSGVCEGTGVSPLNKLGPVLAPGQSQTLSHQDAMAKLMYSRRERTVYERLPSRRMRGNSFRYAGREQSRLMETSLSHINPAYLARYHHLATATQGKQTQHKQGSSEHLSPHKADTRAGEGGGSGDGIQPRAMVLRKITIQDSGKELFSQNIHASPGEASGEASAPGQSPDKVYQRQGLVTPRKTQSERAASETTRTTVSEVHRTGPSLSEQVSVTVQHLTPDAVSHDSHSALSVPSAQAKSVMSTLSVPSPHADDGQGSSPVLSSRTSPSGDKLNSMSSFAVTDLLPAVERNLRSQRTTQRGLNKSKTTADVAATFNSINSRPQQQQQQRRRQQQQQQQKQQQAVVHQPQNNGHASAQNSTGRDNGSRSLPTTRTSGTTNKKSSAAEDTRSFPGFRPHYHITPLQRAKEIANRRMHGHVTQMPDGSETVRVPSPRYASRTDQQTSNRRAKSASRLLGQVMSRYTIVPRNSAA